MNVFKSFWTGLLDFVFPRRCVGCMAEDSWYCERCYNWVKPLEETRCFSCYRPMPFGETCKKCLAKGDVFLDGLVVAGSYHHNKELARAVHALKYSRRTDDLARKLGLLMRSALEGHLPEKSLGKSVLVPVPLHKKRLKERGFNQAELLAKETGFPVDAFLMERFGQTKSQVEVGQRSGRLKNLEGAFRLLKEPDITKVYFLVDDVCTTGATLSVCAKVLKDAGVGQVWGLAVMRA